MSRDTSTRELWPVGTHVRTRIPVLLIPAGARGVIAKVFPAARVYYVHFGTWQVSRMVPAEDLECDSRK